MTTRQALLGPLHRFARDCGVQTAYHDTDGRRVSVGAESLMAVLKALGEPLTTLADVPSATRERRQWHWRRALDPVAVGWDGSPACVELRIPEHLAGARLIGHMELESGERRRWEWSGEQLRSIRAEDVEGERYVAKELPLTGALPWGYHRLDVDGLAMPATTLIIAAPKRAYSPELVGRSGAWGVFLPVYALQTLRNWGCGTFTDLETLNDWVAQLGGGVVATLPLLASFLDGPVFDPSPYSPVSRLMWNEMFVDVESVPEARDSASDTPVTQSRRLQTEVEAHRRGALVDYRGQFQLKRQVLEGLARSLDAHPHRLEELEQFAAAHPAVVDYAAFRAACEKQGTPWSRWPEPLRGGVLGSPDYEEESKQYHVYAQWLAHTQMNALAKRANREDLGLYLDLPLGVHPEGYDVWRNQELYVRGARVGAPPDPFFTGGQDWGFPPFHPERIRERGYGHLIEVLRHHFHYARVLRIDHVMGLHRLYFVPPHHDALHGAYVRYHSDEIYAILALESHRKRCWIVGENLGTVPSYVNSALSRHGLGRMYVAQFEMTADAGRALNPVPGNAVASFGTHDLPTFAAFWRGLDIELRHQMGLVGDADMVEEKRELRKEKRALIEFLLRSGHLKRPAGPAAVYAACMAYLGRSSSRLTLVNLEDLWLETRPQNVPGTGQEQPNWRRKARYSFEEFSTMPQVMDVLKTVDRSRR